MMIFSDVKKTIRFEPDWLVNLKVEADGSHSFWDNVFE